MTNGHFIHAGPCKGLEFLSMLQDNDIHVGFHKVFTIENYGHFQLVDP